MTLSPDKARLTQHLRRALTSLYDPAALRSSVLMQLFDLQHRHDSPSELRRILTNAIESLRPKATTPTGSRSWRVYQVLRRRYTEQLTQHEVAADLGLSVRQLQREEKLAREVLAEYLWDAYRLAEKSAILRENAPECEGTPLDAEEEEAPSRAEELEHLSEVVALSPIDLQTIVANVLETLQPLLLASGTRCDCTLPDELPQVQAKAPLLRQALLSIFSSIVRGTNGGSIRIQALSSGKTLVLEIETQAGETSHTPDYHSDTLEMARQLIELCCGRMHGPSSSNGPRSVKISIALPSAQTITVLAIDDNADVLHLYERYLAGSPYRLVSVHDAQLALERARQVKPRIIVLDVMMPDQDGWALLGQLRTHPCTHTIPVIISTILAQEQLALTLGAAGFIRKPVSQAAFLAALDHQLGSEGPEAVPAQQC